MPEGSFLNYLDQPTAGQDPNTQAAPPATPKKPAAEPKQALSLLDHFLDHFVASAVAERPAESKEEAKPPPSLLDRFLDSFGETEQAAQHAHPEYGAIETTAPPVERQNLPAAAVEAVGRVGGKMLGDMASVADIPRQVFEGGKPGSPEMAGQAREFASTFGMGAAPKGAAASGIGRGPGIATPGFQARTTPLPAGQVPGITDVARGVGHAIETTFSPTTVDTGAGMAEASIRKSLGEARRDTAVSNAALEQYRPLVAPMIKPFQSYVGDVQQYTRAGIPPNQIPPMPKPDALQLIDYMEGRSAGAALPGHLQHLQPVADALRKEMKDRAAAIAADPLTNVTSFIDDYYSHQWREKPNAQTFLSGTRPRMGSGAPLKKRAIPTLSEGIEQGLTPTSFDPIETSMRYIANMDRFLASNEIFATGQNSGIIKFHQPGSAPAGWAPLQGRLAGPTPYGMQAYAPEGYARVYNRSAHVDPGMSGSPVYQVANMAKNAATQTLLGFSGYHYMAMAQEAAVSKLAQSLGRLSEGEMAEAAKAAAIAPFAGITQLPKGKRLQQAYLKQLPATTPNAALYQRIADDLAKAGGRIVGRGQEWRGTQMADYFTAWRRGTLAAELKTGLRDVKSGPISTMPGRAAGMFFREVGRMMETFGKPLFDHMVPHLKGAAFFDEMEGWLASHPAASPMEEMAQARLLWDAIDDRFGEMVMDNVFWKQQLKQGLQLAMVSPGWELGSVRALGGGAKDVARGLARPAFPGGVGGWTPRARWLTAFPIMVALSNAAYQYLRTGKPPESAKDLVAPQTGGQTPEHQPERAMLPGYEKDPIGWFHDPTAKVMGMANPAAKLPYEVATGKDSFTQQPIVQDFPGAPPWLAQWAKHIVQSFEPIPLQQTGKGLPGSALGPASNIMGIRPAPGWLTDPERAQLLQKGHSEAETIRALGTQLYQAKRRGDLSEVRELSGKLQKAKAEHTRTTQGLKAPRRAAP